VRCLRLATTASLASVVTGIASLAQASSLARFPGVWESRGYGQILHVTAEQLVVYDMTDISCSRVMELAFPSADSGYERVASSGDELTLYAEGGATLYSFVQRPELPLRCARRSAGVAADPEFTFAALWHAFRENYAFFELRGVNWADVYARLRPRALAARSDDALFQVMSEALGTLGDGHVVLRAGKRKFNSGRRGELRELWMRERHLSSEDWEQAAPSYAAAVDDHVAKLLGGGRKRVVRGPLSWGWLRPGVGYLNVAAMFMAKTESEPALTTGTQLALFDEAMLQAVTDLAGAEAMVVDMRFNGGGYDSVAMRIAGYFAGEPRLALTKKAVHGTGFTEPQTFTVEPRGGRRYVGPVYVLQSGDTASAAEIFVLAAKALPNVVRVGTRTYGMLSDALGKALPNGWEVTLSNEVYLAADGNLYEHVGIPPDVPVEAPAERFDARLQQDIDLTLTLLKDGTEVPSSW
jgi:carboxyl-terminal processing protease